MVGNAVTQYSIIIGLFLSAMGLGSFLSKYITRHLVDSFIYLQLMIALTGGISTSLLFIMFGMGSELSFFIYLVTIVIGALVGVEIPLLLRMMKGKGDFKNLIAHVFTVDYICLLYTSPSPRDRG